MSQFVPPTLVCFLSAMALLLSLLGLLPYTSASTPEPDRIALFTQRLQQPDVQYCPDKTRLLPDCLLCIPGLQQGAGSTTCNEFVPSSLAIRREIGDLTNKRYGDRPDPNRPFGLYPYLEGPQFMQRQRLYGKMLSEAQAKHILDIGAYYNPIHLFLTATHCPISVVIIEPILPALSAIVPCRPADSNPLGGIEAGRNSKTHIIFMPVTFRFYAQHFAPFSPDGTARSGGAGAALPRPDHVVCIGCDSHYGPNRRMLESSFQRPYTLFLEYPVEYVHNRPYRTMGEAASLGEKTTFKQTLDYATNETRYTKRAMRVIEYIPI